MTASSPPLIDSALAALLARPGAHLHEVTALDRLGAILRTAEPGSLVLVHGAVAADADAVATEAVALYRNSRAEAMAVDSRIEPIVPVDAAFAKGVLDLRFLFSSLMAELGAAPVAVQIPRTASPAERATWARGRRLQLRETADFHLAAVAECRGRSVEVVVVRHLERAGRRTNGVVRGDGAETLVGFAAAADVVVVLAGDHDVLDYRTSATPVEEVHVRRYRPGVATDVNEFVRVAEAELGDLVGDGLAGDPEAVGYLLTQTLGSVALLRAWGARARALLADRGADADPLDALRDRTPLSLVELRAAARRILEAERRLAREAAISEAEVLALLASDPAVDLTAGSGADEPAPTGTPRRYRHPDGLRPGERGLVDDPVGVSDGDAA